MEEVNHFTYGWINPAMAFGFAFIGSLLSLACMNRARLDQNPIRSLTSPRIGWIALASLSLGGTAIWMMHFTAMIGFRVIGSRIAYDPFVTFLSLVASITAVSFGLLLVGAGRRRSILRVLIAGPPTGAGVVLMHYMGMHAINISGVLHHDHSFVIASIVIALIAATVALFFALWLKGWVGQIVGAFIMAIAISAVHYTGMAGVRVTVHDQGRQQVDGIDPIMLTIPILILATLLIIVVLFTLFTHPVRVRSTSTESEQTHPAIDETPAPQHPEGERHPSDYGDLDQMVDDLRPVPPEATAAPAPSPGPRTDNPYGPSY
ncbi:MHYT domain-containing protein [Haloglycomyces albus]|uniref:MHYT domain-containing protein n=1 Tax=Haloglycomyces albus TaxID=526067 RepID=UPI00046CA128|nr:MHYT domain-containing protein [Haloglycomyces albus]